jgi:heme/copper-type cytochrome/quinol oxidase subunit 3
MRRKTIGLLTLLLSIVVCAFFVLRSPDYQNCQAEKAQQSAKKKPDERNSPLMVYVDCLGPFTHENHGPITAIFTIILGLGTFLVWWATHYLVEGSKKTARRQLRAYVFPAGVDFADKGHIPGAPLNPALDGYIYF